MSNPPAAVRILGLDPGLRLTGWGVIEILGSSLHYVAHGVIKTTNDAALPVRLVQLYEGLSEVMVQYHPHEAAVEETFVNTNAASSLKLGVARGVVLLTPGLMDADVFEYSANRVKKAVVGVGHADKTQVATMVMRLLPKAGSVDKDAADALAVAICHAHFRTHRMVA